MRPFEILLLIVTAAALLRPLLPERRRSQLAEVLPGAAGVVLILHVAIEGARWQLAPAYAIVGALVFWAVAGFSVQRRRTAARRLLTGAAVAGGLVFLGAAAAAGTLVPIIGFPKPTGPYPIGTVTYDWTDASRGEPATEDPSDHRELMVQVWYPATHVAGVAPAPYLPRLEVAAPALARWIDMPAFFLDHIALVHTHAQPNVPMAPGRERFPVLIFSHGNGGVRTQNTVQIEELASHGYVVASIDHTYNSTITVFPDGRTVTYERGGIEFVHGTPEAEAAHAERVRFRVADVSFVLNQLTRANRGELHSPFYGRLDLDRAGVFGHSYGGATATLACALDPRFRAGINYDGWIWGDVIETGLDRPFMFMWATERFGPPVEELAGIGMTVEEDAAHRAMHNREARSVYERLPEGYWLSIQGTAHYNFSDIPLLSPAAHALGLTGPIDGRRGLRIINAYTLAFFDKYLKGEVEPLLDGPSADYPDVDFERRGPTGPATT